MSAPQHVYNALKKMRETGEAWVTWKGERLRLRSVAKDECWRPGGPFPAIIKSRGHGGIAMAEVWWHEGRLHLYEGRGVFRQGNEKVTFRRGNDRVVLAMVAERHPGRMSND